ncbi:hypothetical protein [Aureibacter tunicatorum]|uniref:Sugar lactone lactonase YvrE n=1 Tax=Aureibacter tunicatorum TaxID=866807 RepID=A0AAE3XMU6_9BACT|nr:hypothetical protein [Aureibacter tunicatorum]MDR6238666.1 sugar lactone lactonase YvrE [Aureibacter tunicatorum]BDD05403.1 gluconolactonase [Aureibacter tunicatorum]
MRKKLLGLASVFLLGSMSSCWHVGDPWNGGHPTQNVSIDTVDVQQIVLEKENLFPEGIAYDLESKQVFLSAYKEGAIYSYDHKGQLVKVFESDLMISPGGVKIDQKRNLMYVAVGAIGVSDKYANAENGALTALAVYDLKTKEQVNWIDLTSLGELPCYGNDICLDQYGNVYMTDSQRPVVYKISKEGEAEVLAQSDQFSGFPFNLNGITYHPDGFILTVQMGSGILFKIDTETGSVAEVAHDTDLRGGDGINLINENQLIVAQAYEVQEDGSWSLGALKMLETDNDWSSASMTFKTTKGMNGPTNTEVINDNLLVVQSYIGSKLFAGQSQSQFEITKYKLK